MNKLNEKDQEYYELEQKLKALLKEKDDVENELRQTQNTEHIQHLNSVLRDQDELIVSLTDKVEMYKKMHSMTVAELEVWKNTHNTAYTDEEIQKLINEKNELQKQKIELQKSLDLKEQEIKKKDEELQALTQQGKETCACGQNKISNEEIQDCLKKEFDISRTCYCLDGFPGYQILHDVLITLGQKWKHAEITMKYCNFKIISQDGFPVKVALYTQWPYKIIECTIQGEDACCIEIVNEIIPKAIRQVLTEKALSVQLKFLCAHPDCSEVEKHFATPDRSGKPRLVCDRKNKLYVCFDESQQKVLEAYQQSMGVLSCGLSTQVSYTSEYKYKEIIIFREESQRYKQENLLEQEKKITLGVHMVFERWRSFRTLQDWPSITSENNCDNAAETRKGIKRVLQNNHAKLNKLPKTSLKSLADHLYADDVISRDVMANPSMDNIIGEFELSLEFKKRKQDIENHCAKFFKAFAEIGGSYAIAVEEMEKDLNNKQ